MLDQNTQKNELGTSDGNRIVTGRKMGSESSWMENRTQHKIQNLQSHRKTEKKIERGDQRVPQVWRSRSWNDNKKRYETTTQGSKWGKTWKMENNGERLRKDSSGKINGQRGTKRELCSGSKPTSTISKRCEIGWQRSSQQHHIDLQKSNTKRGNKIWAKVRKLKLKFRGQNDMRKKNDSAMWSSSSVWSRSSWWIDGTKIKNFVMDCLPRKTPANDARYAWYAVYDTEKKKRGNDLRKRDWWRSKPATLAVSLAWCVPGFRVSGVPVSWHVAQDPRIPRCVATLPFWRLNSFEFVSTTTCVTSFPFSFSIYVVQGAPRRTNLIRFFCGVMTPSLTRFVTIVGTPYLSVSLSWSSLALFLAVSQLLSFPFSLFLLLSMGMYVASTVRGVDHHLRLAMLSPRQETPKAIWAAALLHPSLFVSCQRVPTILKCNDAVLLGTTLFQRVLPAVWWLLCRWPFLRFFFFSVIKVFGRNTFMWCHATS